MRELPDSSAPERAMNTPSELKRRLPHKGRGCGSGMPLVRRSAATPRDSWLQHGPDGRRPGRHAYFGLRCGHSVLSGRVQGIQAEFSPRPMGRKLSTWAEAKFRTPGGILVPSAVPGAAICWPLPGRRCDIRVRRWVTSGLPRLIQTVGAYSRDITEHCLAALPPGAEHRNRRTKDRSPRFQSACVDG